VKENEQTQLDDFNGLPDSDGTVSGRLHGFRGANAYTRSAYRYAACNGVADSSGNGCDARNGRRL
jgi:hypothetical protein